MTKAERSNRHRREVRKAAHCVLMSAKKIRDMMRDDRWGRASWQQTMTALLDLGAEVCEWERVKKYGRKV